MRAIIGTSYVKMVLTDLLTNVWLFFTESFSLNEGQSFGFDSQDVRLDGEDKGELKCLRNNANDPRSVGGLTVYERQ